jgi:8-oxo-dGTP pyrophosphatase MutT (NUDIX family)
MVAGEISSMDSGPRKIVRPRHAASLVLLKGDPDRPNILMGRRPPKSAFIPDAFVFPGGRLDTDDMSAEPSAPLPAQTLRMLIGQGGCTPKMATALANTAIRETFEETGLLLAGPGEAHGGEGWAEFRARDLAPDHSQLGFLGRAITPTASPIRYHARFFVARGEGLAGVLTPTDELSDLDWYPVEDALRLPVIDVTHFILTLVSQGRAHQSNAVPFFRYRRNKPLSAVRRHE